MGYVCRGQIISLESIYYYEVGDMCGPNSAHIGLTANLTLTSIGTGSGTIRRNILNRGGVHTPQKSNVSFSEDMVERRHGNTKKHLREKFARSAETLST